MSHDSTYPDRDALVVARRLALLAGVPAVLLIGLGALCLAGLAPAMLRVAAELAMSAGVAAAAAAVTQLRSLRAPVEAEPSDASEPNDSWDGRDRRGPNRARNVARLPKKTAANADPDDDQWEAF